MINNGIKVELDFVKNMDGKMYIDINNNLKKFLEFLFGKISDDTIVRCFRLNNMGKADIKIKVDNICKYVSIKTGSENSVHTEKLNSFISFLRSINVDDNIINILKFYHYGDYTLDGSGSKRYSADYLKLIYRKDILKFNNYINNDYHLKNIISRVIFEGRKKYNKPVDAIYYGTTRYGLWCSKEELITYFLENKHLFINTPHFSSLTYQNWCRNINFNSKSEAHRNYVQIKWFSMVSDINKIRK